MLNVRYLPFAFLLTGAALSAQTIVQLESRSDFESTYRESTSVDTILISRRGLELSRLLAGALAHAEATGDNSYRHFFESIRTYGDCIKNASGPEGCRAATRSPRLKGGASRDRFLQLKEIYYNAFYRILQIQGQARLSLKTRKLKPASEAFELQNEILRTFSLNREHSIDRLTVQLLRGLPPRSDLQPIPDDSLYLIFLRSLASLPQDPLAFQENKDLPANTGIARVDRLKDYLRKNGLRQTLYRVPGSLRKVASNI